VKFTILITRESCTNAKAKYSSSVVPPDPSVHVYHWFARLAMHTCTQNRDHATCDIRSSRPQPAVPAVLSAVDVA